MWVDELVGSIQTYEMTLPSSQKPKDYAFKAFENEEKDTKMSYNITKDELAHMAKRIKKVMKFNKRFYKNQEFGKWKDLMNNHLMRKEKAFSKECFNYGELWHFAIDCPIPKDIKNSMQATWSDTDFEKSASITFEDAKYDPNGF